MPLIQYLGTGMTEPMSEPFKTKINVAIVTHFLPLAQFSQRCLLLIAKQLSSTQWSKWQHVHNLMETMDARAETLFGSLITFKLTQLYQQLCIHLPPVMAPCPHVWLRSHQTGWPKRSLLLMFGSRTLQLQVITLHRHKCRTRFTKLLTLFTLMLHNQFSRPIAPVP